MRRQRTRRHRAASARHHRMGILAGATLLTIGIAVGAVVTPAQRAYTDRAYTGGQLVVMSSAERESLVALPPNAPARTSTPASSDKPMKSVPSSGSGQFTTATGSTERVGDGNLTTYRVEVERELPWNPDEIAAVVDSTLASDRGWIRAGNAFQRQPGAALRILVATPKTVDRLCAPLNTQGELSCRNGNMVAINAERWQRGIDAYPNIDGYRRYVINHEVGHALGYGHRRCAGSGTLAPVMQQQTVSMQGCEVNPWPTVDEIR